MTRPLDDILVLDLSRLLPGPYCTMLLDDLGAEVIKIEEPRKGDHARSLIPILFEAFNRNKKSLSLNLKSAEGKDLFLHLAARSDVLVESFRPGVMAGLGLAYETLREANRRLIYCAISGYGQEGSLSKMSGHDLNYLGVSGMLSLCGSPDGPPAPGVALPIADLSAGMFATIGILAALQARQRTGEGQLIDVSMTDGLLSWVGTYLPEHDRGMVSKKKKMCRPAYGVFRTGDAQFITIGAIEDHFWKRLLAVLELSDALGGPEYHTFAKRTGHVESINRILQEKIATRPGREWLRLFRERDIPCGPVNFLDDLGKDPWIVSRDLIVKMDTPSFGVLKGVRSPLTFSWTGRRTKQSAPRLGEHNEEILRRLGVRAHEIASLRRKGVIGGC